MKVGKDYIKGDPVRGAAVLTLTMELKGAKPGASIELLMDTLKDLGVTKKQVEKYIKKHRDELVALLKEQGLK